MAGSIQKYKKWLDQWLDQRGIRSVTVEMLNDPKLSKLVNMLVNMQVENNKAWEPTEGDWVKVTKPRDH